MASHYLFFLQQHAHNFIDVMRPRQRPNEPRKRFNFNIRFEPQYDDLAFFVMNDGQRQRIRGEARPPKKLEETGENRPAIYTVGDMVTAELVDFTSAKLEPGVRTFRADFFTPVEKQHFAYATTYGSGKFGERMLKQKGLKLEMIKFQGYYPGQPISEAIKGVFLSYGYALLNNHAFSRYNMNGLALVVPGKLIERE